MHCNRKGNDFIEIIVEDTGKGMAADRKINLRRKVESEIGKESGFIITVPGFNLHLKEALNTNT